MAKWGEGDPRWIVEDRPDGTNVNNWHWTEKNSTSWSKDKITALLTDLKVENEFGCATINELSSIEGEAVVNNRKAKLIFFYEWVIKGKWSAKLKDNETDIKGEFEVPNLSEENDPSELDVQITYTDNSQIDKDQKIKDLLRTKGTKLIQQQLGTYIKELKEEYAKDLILPTKDASNNKNQTVKPEQVKSMTKITNKGTTAASKNADQLSNLKSLALEEEFKCTATDFYNALTKEELLSIFTHDKATCTGKVGGKFSILGGNVEGEFTELVAGSLIKQKWRFKNWPKDHYSNVTFKIESKDDCILVKLEQNNIPSVDFERTNEGWKYYYFDSMKRSLGFGSTLF